jgi:hypothetical protein
MRHSDRRCKGPKTQVLSVRSSLGSQALRSWVSGPEIRLSPVGTFGGDEIRDVHCVNESWQYWDQNCAIEDSNPVLDRGKERRM